MRVVYLLIVLSLFIPAIAKAQSTPQSYCATISGCEILAIKITPLSYAYGINGNPGATTSAGHVEYCRGSDFKVVPFFAKTVGESNGNNHASSIAIFQSASGAPVTMSMRTGMTNTALCASSSALP